MEKETGTWKVKAGLAQMLKGGVIMDVVSAEQAKVAEDAGACSVMALERVPADIRAAGGVARMADLDRIEGIMKAVTIPVMAKCRIGHFVEAQVLEAIGVDYIDESEVLTPADDQHHVWKHDFKVPFVCGCRDLGEALRRVSEGAAMIRTKGEAGTGDIVEAVRHMRAVMNEVRIAQALPAGQLTAKAKELGVSLELLREVKKLGRLPVVNFAGRWRCDAGRRRADDAARRRWSVRRLRHLQGRRSRGHRSGYRQGGDPLPGPRRRRGGLQGHRRVHGGCQRQLHAAGEMLAGRGL